VEGALFSFKKKQKNLVISGKPEGFIRDPGSQEQPLIRMTRNRHATSCCLKFKAPGHSLVKWIQAVMPGGLL